MTSASASPAGNKIQVRVTWKDEENKTVIGYNSYRVDSLRKKSFDQLFVSEFIVSVFYGIIGYRNDFLSVFEERMKEDEFKKKVGKLAKTAFDTLKEALDKGTHAQKRNLKDRKDATEALNYWIPLALKAGMEPKEINQMIKEAVVKLVHAS